LPAKLISSRLDERPSDVFHARATICIMPAEGAAFSKRPASAVLPDARIIVNPVRDV
jgi:hypothetical protein